MKHEVEISHLERHGSGWTATVEVGPPVSDQTTTHHVSVDDDYYEHLTDGKYDVETLLEETFKFLLERESNESILRQFDLDVIGNYFDDYEKVIVEKLEKNG